MSLITIKRDIPISPRYLGKGIRKHIKGILEKNMIGKCSNEYGYIIGINSVKKLAGNMISPVTSQAIFSVEFLAEVLKPEIGKTMIGKVCMVLSEGLFIMVGDKLNILIPVESMGDYELNGESGIPRYVKGDDSIEEDTMVEVTITGVKYSDGEFSTYGSLKNKV